MPLEVVYAMAQVKKCCAVYHAEIGAMDPKISEAIAQAAEQLDKSEAVIYAARSRIMRRLRDAVKGLEDDKS